MEHTCKMSIRAFQGVVLDSDGNAWPVVVADVSQAIEVRDMELRGEYVPKMLSESAARIIGVNTIRPCDYEIQTPDGLVRCTKDTPGAVQALEVCSADVDAASQPPIATS